MTTCDLLGAEYCKGSPLLMLLMSFRPLFQLTDEETKQLAQGYQGVTVVSELRLKSGMQKLFQARVVP